MDVSAARHSLAAAAALAPRQRAPPLPGADRDRPLGRGPPDPALERVGPGSRAREAAWWSARSTATSPPARRWSRGCAASHPPRGTALWLIEDANPDGAAANTRHNAARRGPQPQLPLPLAARRTGSTSPARGRRPSPRPRRSSASSSAMRPRVTLWYHQALRMVVAQRRRRRAPAPLLAPQRPAAQAAAALPRHGQLVAELDLPRRHRVRRRAAGRAAARRGRAPPRERRAGAGPRGRAAARHAQADPLRRRPQGRHARLRAPPLRHRRLPPARAAGDRRALHGHRHLPAGLRHLRPERARPELRRAARHLQPLRGRPRRHDLPARPDDDHVPAHRRAQLHGDRDRARRAQRRPGARQPAPAGRLAAAHAHAPGPLRDPHAQRDRPQREPLEPVPPRARGAPAHADARATSRKPAMDRYRRRLERLPAPASLR